MINSHWIKHSNRASGNINCISMVILCDSSILVHCTFVVVFLSIMIDCTHEFVVSSTSLWAFYGCMCGKVHNTAERSTHTLKAKNIIARTTFISVLLFHFSKSTHLASLYAPYTIPKQTHTHTCTRTQRSCIESHSARSFVCMCAYILCEWNVSPCVFVSFHCKSGSHSLCVAAMFFFCCE